MCKLPQSQRLSLPLARLPDRGEGWEDYHSPQLDVGREGRRDGGREGGREGGRKGGRELKGKGDGELLVEVTKDY